MPLGGVEDVSLAYGVNHWDVDRPYRAMYRALGGSKDFSGLGSYASREVYEVAYRVDRLSWPVLLYWSVRGERLESSWLDPSLRGVLRRLVLDYGVNRHPYAGGSWLDHYTGIYLVGDPGVSCVLTITMQTAHALYKYGGGEVRGLYENLAGLREPLMWGATWYTEVSGGSDLGSNQTVAEQGDGVWRLTGYKYFASGAGIADVALVSARPRGGPPGAKGLELFAVPREYGGRLNFRVVRLKWKSGTIAVPTGEVELDSSAGFLLGERGKGIYYIMENLMVSRLANSVGALGIARKAYLEAYLYALERRAFGRRIIDHELARRDLLEMELEIEAMTALTLKAIREYESSWMEEPPYSRGYHYARLLTHMAKNLTAQASKDVTAAAMELWGGIGFLHEFPVERWHREAMITPIWEGTSNIHALDMLEAMAKKRAHEAMIEDLRAAAGEAYDAGVAGEALRILEDTVKSLAASRPAEAEYRAKEALNVMGRAVAVIVMEWIAGVEGDEWLAEAARLYHEYRLKGRPLPRPRGGVVEEIISLRGGLPG